MANQQGVPVGLAIEGLMIISANIAKMLIWTVFLTVHLAVAVVALGVLWWFQISPQGIQSVSGRVFHHGWFVPKAAGTVAFLGISGWAVLRAYAKTWRWMLLQISGNFLPKGS